MFQHCTHHSHLFNKCHVHARLYTLNRIKLQFQKYFSKELHPLNTVASFKGGVVVNTRNSPKKQNFARFLPTDDPQHHEIVVHNFTMQLQVLFKVLVDIQLFDLFLFPLISLNFFDISHYKCKMNMQRC
jgi:hypothetical protein